MISEPKNTNQPEESKGEPKSNTNKKKFKITKGPNPSRFLEYMLLPDESGFVIHDCDYVFYFDDDGGWYDENKNYYDKDGVPALPPDNDDDTDDYGTTEDDYDDLVQALGLSDGEDEQIIDEEIVDDEDDVLLQVGNKKNPAKLKDLPADAKVYFELSNIPLVTEEEHFIAYLEKVRGIPLEKYSFGDTICKIKVSNKKIAQKLARFNGKRFDGRPIYVSIKDNTDDLKFFGDEKPREYPKAIEPTKEEPKTSEKFNSLFG